MRIPLHDIDFSSYPPQERIAFAQQLLGDAVAELCGGEFTPEQIASFQADADAYRVGGITSLSWAEVQARLSSLVQ